MSATLTELDVDIASSNDNLSAPSQHKRLLPHLPYEIHVLILEHAELTEYLPLRLVCKSWNAALDRILWIHYHEIFLPDSKWLQSTVSYPYKFHRPGLSPGEVPFLINPALSEFPGYLRGSILPVGYPFVFYPTREEHMDPKDDKGVLEYMKMVRGQLDAPIIISKGRYDEDIEMGCPVRLKLIYWDGGLAQTSSRTLTLERKGGKLRKEGMMKVKEFLGWVFAMRMESVLGHPGGGKKQCSVYAVKDYEAWSGDPSSRSLAPIMINIHFTG
ncbi:hypothetical protein TWF694_007219 [Orbilia ellipsospora]|uniref:F-box domain-containing protein n=1 Tax=Orbilia ellipsospora TaxID=2528407 RepID=A0AAV9XIJ0_9PEZI